MVNIGSGYRLLLDSPKQLYEPMIHHQKCSLQGRHNERDGVSNHQPHDCLLNRLFKA